MFVKEFSFLADTMTTSTKIAVRTTKTSTETSTEPTTEPTTRADVFSAKNYFVTFTDESMTWNDSFANPSTTIYQQLKGDYENNVNTFFCFKQIFAKWI